ncbi:hypothetical protein J4Q44_G00092900 [Coregonus suidteri]|uniref:Uncharacterized protein n=1 Tax=Coregonus suidteri TaxID=861788 RepID=A0AAN8LYX8_9TELE
MSEEMSNEELRCCCLLCPGEPSLGPWKQSTVAPGPECSLSPNSTLLVEPRVVSIHAIVELPVVSADCSSAAERFRQTQTLTETNHSTGPTAGHKYD